MYQTTLLTMGNKKQITELSNGSFNLKIGDKFVHKKSKAIYQIKLFANVEDDQRNKEKYPPSVVYMNVHTGRFFVRKICDFGNKSFEEVKK